MELNRHHSKEEIEAFLDELLEVEFTFRLTAEPAESLAGLEQEEQLFMLDWIKRVASTNLELGYQVACRGVEALQGLDRHMIEAWALHTMDTYDRSGLQPAMRVIEGLSDFAHEQQQRIQGAVLQEHEGVLQGFLNGLSGRALRLSESEQVYTDSEKVFLPALWGVLPDEMENFRLYKACSAFLWAQTRYGAFSTLRRHDLFQQETPDELLQLFYQMESLRLESIISRELPGLYREVERIKTMLEEPELPAEWAAVARQLADPKATAEDVLILTRAYHGKLALYPRRIYHGGFNREAVAATMDARIEREKAKFRISLDKIIQELDEKTAEAGREEPRQFSQRLVEEETVPEGFEIEILLDDQPLALPPDVENTLSSIIQDLSELPEEYLHPAGPGEYDPNFIKEEDEEEGESVWSGTYHEEGAFIYAEWDYQRKHYRKNWCAMREINIKPLYDDFYRQTMGKYSGLVKHLRKTFEAMRDEDRLLKRQPHGDGVDIDALVEALADQKLGREMTDRLFTRMHRTERNIAVVFMVDMSGSTKGWINDAEREALILLCEALETLGDRYAIYGFSSITRKRCELYRIKRFEDPYNDEVKARISGIEPKDYTRMGFAIRHLTALLKDVDARTRMLITLSDGKPDDYDNYRGVYGIEDTRRALIEARRDGVHPYCITIDDEAKDYLPHLYGPAAYTVLSDVGSLPLKVSDIYRRLTT
ncbi:MAG: VWA domain-containing protein [Candidatus Sedimenticola sp. PURPLELP]